MLKQLLIYFWDLSHHVQGIILENTRMITWFVSAIPPMQFFTFFFLKTTPAGGVGTEFFNKNMKSHNVGKRGSPVCSVCQSLLQ